MRREGPAIAAIVLAGFAARLVWIALVHPQAGLFDDAGYYDYFARSLAAGHGYRMPWGTPTAFWPVGYPAALGAVYFGFGTSLLAAKMLNVVLGAATVFVVYALGRRWLSPSQSALAALIFALMPGAIGFASLTLSESLFTFLFTASVFVLSWAPEEGRRVLSMLAFAAIAAAATYVRGEALLLPLVAVPWLFSQGWPLRRALSFGGATMAVVLALCLPWSVRNSLTFHEPLFLSTNLGVNLWAGHHRGANGGLQFGEQVEFASQFSDLPPLDQEPAESRQGLSDAFDFATSHPGAEIALAGKKIVRLYRDDSDALRWNEHNSDAPIFSAQRRHQLGIIFDVSFYVIGALALAGLGAGLVLGKPWAMLLGLAGLYWTGVHVVAFAEPRFHAPLLPLMAVLAAVSLTEMASAVRRLLDRPTTRA